MTQAITDAITAEIGAPFDLGRDQVSDLGWASENGKDMDAIATAIPDQLEALAAILSRETGLKDVPLRMVAPCLNLTDAITFLPTSTSALSKMRRADVFEAGRLLERQENALADPDIVALYDEVFGEYPDALGHAFWGAEKAKGMSIDQIRRFMIADRERSRVE